MKKVEERFLEYVKIDTESVEDVEIFPSNKEKIDVIANKLVAELEAMHATNVRMDDYGYIYATIPATIDKKVPVIGFVSHMDTAPALTGKNVKPRIVEKYDGHPIVLNKEKDIHLSPDEYPEMLNYLGQDLIVTDGNTLLGADDKAGVAEIMTMAETLLSNPSIPHGTIQIAFTPDEEVGRGVDFFDVKEFGADFAYTVDGGEIGEIEYENFNAAAGKVAIQGLSIHPGSAKGKMINALLVAMHFQSMLPVEQAPQYTEGYEGFYMVNEMKGSVDSASMSYIIRDHDMDKFKTKKERFKKIADYLNDVYGQDTVRVEIKDSYYNMKEKVEPHMHLIETAIDAMKELDIEPIVTPIRGGTDGARLSFMGLPCPNICAGGHNFHGRYEYVPIQSMEKIVDLLLGIVQRYGQRTEW